MVYFLCLISNVPVSPFLFILLQITKVQIVFRKGRNQGRKEVMKESRKEERKDSREYSRKEWKESRKDSGN